MGDRRSFLRAAIGGIGIASDLSVVGRKTTTDRAGESSDADFYVSPDGNNANSGTRGAPFKDIEVALEASSPGDLVLVRSGTYTRDHHVHITGISGSASNPIKVKGETNPEPPTIAWSDDTDDGGIDIHECEYLEFETLEITRSPQKGIRILDRSNNVTLKGIHAHDNGHAGISVNNSKFNRLIQVVSHDNYDEESGGKNADGIQVGGPNATGNLLRQVQTFQNSDDGIDLFGSRGTIIEDSVSWRNGVGPEGEPKGDGNGFKLGGGAESGGNRVTRCIAYSNELRGFDYNAAQIPNVLVNNTAWNNPLNFRFQEAAHELLNNISADGETETELSEEVVEIANSWNLGIDDPEFETTDPDSDSFLHLTENSPAIDAGVEANVPYQGEAPDLGAIEYMG